MNELEIRKQHAAQAVARYLSADTELLQTFREFDIAETSYDRSPQNFYCGWVMSIMGTAFYNRWNEIRQQIADNAEMDRQDDWATISALAHDLVAEDE